MRAMGSGKNDWELRGARLKEADAMRAPDLEMLFRDHFTDLCKSINRVFGPGPPEPEDLVQDAFERYARLEDRSGISNPRSFLFITAKNIALDFKRRRKTADGYLTQQTALGAATKLEEITPERVVLAKDYVKALTRALNALPRKQQIILVKSRLEGKSFKQIQKETGWSVGDISRNLHTAMELLVEEAERRRGDKSR